MVRQPAYITPEGRQWLMRLELAQLKVERAEQERDHLVRQALANGLGVRGVAKALRIDKATVSRRYGKGQT